MKQKNSFSDYYDADVYELAGLVDRVIALIIDGIIIGIFASIAAAMTLGIFAGITYTVVSVLYYIYYLTQQNGQTIGKRWMGVRVVRADGAPLTWVDVIVRYLGYAVNSAIFGLGWLWALIDENRQGWHDKLANTYVVKA